MMCCLQQILIPARWMGGAKVGDSSKDVVGTVSVDLPRQYFLAAGWAVVVSPLATAADLGCGRS